MVEEPFEIRNENDLFRAIQLVEEGGWPDGQLPVFIGWPRYQITIRGEDFNGGVPTRIMPALLELQRALRCGYARSVHGSVRRLGREDRRQTELVVRLEPGSTTFWSELAPLLNAAVRNMSGTETVITVLGLAVIAGGSWLIKARINQLAQARELEHRAAMSAEETRRLSIVNGLAHDRAELAEQLSDMRAAQSELLKRLGDNDSLFVGGEEAVNGNLAKQMIRPERQELVAARLDSTFRILSVESGSVHDGFRIRVLNIADGALLSVSIPAGTLSAENQEALQNGEWQKRLLQLEINTMRRGNRIVRATLISAGLARADGG